MSCRGLTSEQAPLYRFASVMFHHKVAVGDMGLLCLQVIDDEVCLHAPA